MAATVERGSVTLALRNSDHKTITLMDAIAVFWLLLWLVIAGLASYEIWSLSRLSDSAEVSAGAVDRAGRALQGLGELPLVGAESGELGTEIRTAAADIRESAARTRADVHQLSVLLGVSIFLIPSSPVLGLYVPLRLRRRRDVAALRKRATVDPDDPSFQAYLAQRALTNMTYDELLTVSADPARDVARGRHSALAAAELDRLGLVPRTRN
jgi:hypothetical protein